MTIKRISLKTHFTTAQLKERYLKCDDLVEKSHWQAIWSLSRQDKNYSCEEIGDLMGFSADWVRKLVRRYNANPETGLQDGRRKNGNEPILSTKQQEKLHLALESPPPDHGLWSGPKVALWIREELKRPVSAVTGWHYLVRLGWSLQVPRRRHDRAASPEEQAAFKKKLEKRVEQLRNDHPGKKIEIWAEDEARLGLQPVIRRQGFKVGSKPRATHRIQYKWIYTYGFVNPATGETHWLFLPSVSCELMELALNSFAREYCDENKIIILLWDQAGFHQTETLRIPEGIEAFPLPPYTPELQPAERLWPSLHEAFANRWVRTLDHLEALLTDRIRALIKTPELIQSLTGFS